MKNLLHVYMFCMSTIFCMSIQETDLLCSIVITPRKGGIGFHPKAIFFP